MSRHDRVPATAGWAVSAVLVVGALVASGDDDSSDPGPDDFAREVTEVTGVNTDDDKCKGCRQWEEDILTATTPEELQVAIDGILDLVAADADPDERERLGLGDRQVPDGEPTGIYTFEELQAFVLLANAYAGGLDRTAAIEQLTAIEGAVDPRIATLIERARVDLPARDLALGAGDVLATAEELKTAVADAGASGSIITADDLAVYELLADYALAAPVDAAQAEELRSELLVELDAVGTLPLTAQLADDALTADVLAPGAVEVEGG